MATVKLNNGTRKNSVLGQLVRVDPNNPKNFIAVDLNGIDVIGTVAEIRQPGNPTIINLINTANWDDILGIPFNIDDYQPLDNDLTRLAIYRRIGGDSHYTQFDATGHATMIGDARPWRDELGDALGLQKNGVGITLNLDESTVDFDYNSTYNVTASLADFLYKNVQLNHDKDLTATLYPHLHWFQSKNYIPNLLFEYRWQKNNGIKVTAWTKLKCVNLAFAYTPGTTLHQISYSAGIAVPPGTTLSDIVQFRIYRDTSNASGEFIGITCPYNTGGNASVPILSFDCHFQINSHGSTDELSK
jgi:hypothetical protein